MFFACGHISQSAVRAGNDIIAVPRGISGRNEKDELVRDRDAARDTRDIVSLRERSYRAAVAVVGLVQFSSSRFEACVSDTSPSFFPRSLSRVRLSRLVLFLPPSILLSLVECVCIVYIRRSRAPTIVRLFFLSFAQTVYECLVSPLCSRFCLFCPLAVVRAFATLEPATEIHRRPAREKGTVPIKKDTRTYRLDATIRRKDGRQGQTRNTRHRSSRSNSARAS